MGYYVSHAQLTRVGGGLSFSSGIEDFNHKTGNPGLTGRGVIEIGEKFWVVPELSFFLPGKRQHNTFGMATTMFGTIDANATYAIAKEGTILFYALAGGNLSIISSKFDASERTTDLLPAFNIGTGIEMIVEQDINAFAQVRGVIGSYQYVMISLGVHYYISGRRYRAW
jgi:hypothetical protein